MDQAGTRRLDRTPEDPSRGRRIVALVGLLVGALMCWLLAPMMEVVFEPAPRDQLRWVPDSWLPGYDVIYDRTGRRLGLSAYYFWGRLAFLIFLVGAMAVTAMPRGRIRLTRVGRRLLLIAFSVGTVADIGSYWGGTGRPATGSLPPAALQAPPDQNFGAATVIGYSVELLAMLMILMGLLLFGVGLLRERRRPVWGAWTLIVGAVSTISIVYFGALYIAHGFLFPVLVAMAIALIGYLVTVPRT